MSNTPENKIYEWLQEQGYPLEMHVASNLFDAGYHVQQSYFYSDPETKESREIDILATKGDHTGLFEVSFFIECKATKKPWLLLTSEFTLDGYNRFFAFSIYPEETKDEFIDLVFDDTDFTNNIPWFNKNERIAYGMTQALTSGKDIAYQASLSALKSCVAKIREYEGKAIKPYWFVFPIIVLDCDLYEAHLDKTGNLKINKVEKCFYSFRKEISGALGCCIYVITKSYLPSFINEANEITQKLNDLFKTKAKNKLKKK